MKSYCGLVLSFFAVVALTLGSLARADEKEALGLAESGVTLVGAGKIEKAKDQFYKALAHDSNCPTALYELGKLFELEQKNVSAADFLARAAVELAKREKQDPTYAGKCMDAKRRLTKLNPYAAHYVALMEEYASEIGKIAKKTPDSLTLEEAQKRFVVLDIAEVLPKDKIPVIEKPIATKTPPATPSKRSPGEESGYSQPKKTAANNFTPEVERALKGAGWTTISGTWVKKAENVYEVTDGKIEATKTNGGVQVLLHKGGTGSMKVFVRNGHKPFDGMGSGVVRSSSGGTSSSGSLADRYPTGYGFMVKDGSCKVYVPTGGWTSGDEYEPTHDHTVALPDGKTSLVITCEDTTKATRLELMLNGKRENLSNYRIARSGPMTIEIAGTMTIEAPKAAGM